MKIKPILVMVSAFQIVKMSVCLAEVLFALVIEVSAEIDVK